jgi:hypothetical protein
MFLTDFHEPTQILFRFCNASLQGPLDDFIELLSAHNVRKIRRWSKGIHEETRPSLAL